MKVLYARTQFYFDLKSGGSVGHTLGILNGLVKNGCDLHIATVEKFWGIGGFNLTLVKPKTTTRLFP